MVWVILKPRINTPALQWQIQCLSRGGWVWHGLTSKKTNCNKLGYAVILNNLSKVLVSASPVNPTIIPPKINSLAPNAQNTPSLMVVLPNLLISYAGTSNSFHISILKYLMSILNKSWSINLKNIWIHGGYRASCFSLFM